MNDDKRRKIERNAQKLMGKKSYAKAIKEYLVLLNNFPDDTSYLKYIAQCYSASNNNEDALKYYRKLTEIYRKKSLLKQSVAIYKIMISIGDESIETYEYLAEAYISLGMKNDAAIVFRKPLETFMLKKEYTKAIEIAHKILEFNSNDTIAIINIAESELALGENRDAIKYFKRAAALYKEQNNLNMYVKILGRINHVTNESDPEILNELAILYVSQKSYGPELLEILLKSYRISKARKDYDALIETTKLLVTFFKETNQRKQMLSIRYELAKIYEDLGSFDKALDVYNKILQIAPGSIEVKKKAKELNDKINKAKGVVPETIKTVKIPNPKREKVQIKNAIREIETFIKFRLYDKALKVVEELHERYPDNQLVLKKMKEVYIGSSDMKNAIKVMFELFEGSFKRDKSEARSYLEEIIYYDANNSKAHTYLEKYFGVKPQAVVVDQLVDYNETSEVDDDDFIDSSAELIEDVDSINPEDLIVSKEKSNPDKKKLDKIKFYINQGLYSNAKSELDILLKKDSSNKTYLKLFSELEKAMKPTISESDDDIDKMVEMFKSGVKKSVDKSDTKTRYDLAIAYKEMGLIDTAIDELKLLLKTTDKKKDVLLLLGLCFNDKEEYSYSIKYFKKSLEYSKTLSEKISIYYEIANSYELKGNLEQAYKIFKKIIKKDKNFRDSLKRIKALQTKLKPNKPREISYL